ncbi:hypothetical protein CIPAW_13G167800 [Carya illinoinensis]|uniref:Receptor-like serine/threonine-protein kinase n=2 Tax=Carya illinoinensis TaxID=32201 RepID=A0A8T1NV00_CARIL|nr:hypothetical protein CIPAW_13G167800 [Carya illinoinensis]
MAMAFLPPWLLVSLLILLPISTVAQSNGNITAGDSLIAAANSSSWLSPSGDFAFGFSPHSDKDFFLLSIWFANIPDRTIVWYANGDKPAPRGSKVELTADRGLVLTDPQDQQLWSSQTIIGTVASGVMTDEGNFVLQDREFTTVWESFNSPTTPTDTLLPTQNLTRGGVLSSRQSETNFSTGRFRLRLQQDGNLVLVTVNLPTDYANEAYYASGTTSSGDPNPSSPGRVLVFNESGYMFILRDNGQQVRLTQGQPVESSADFYFRATLNFDGVFTLYSHPKASNSNRSWSPLWSLPENICVASLVSEGIGVCGYNSICTLKADGRPMCGCPRGYSLLDPDDQYGSCKPDFIPGCEEDRLSPPGEDLYTWEDLTNTDWPSSDYALLRPCTENQCRQSCLEDCMCAVAIFRLGNSCWKKKLPLSNGRVDSSLNGGKALIKIRKNNSTLPVPDPPSDQYPEPKKKNQHTLILIGLVLLGGSAFVIVILIVAVCLGRFSFIYHNKQPKIIANASSVQLNLRCFTYKELEEATDGFKEELGKGAFGVVYKGTIQMGSSVHVAVKKLNNSFQDGEREFRTEVSVIGQTHHKNLVRLLGFCDEGQQRLLVYEFLSNGTLAGFLFGDLKPSWNRRIEIAIGIARGLLYLHEECSSPIIHCDIKPQNILLDDYYNARIADFGLAKLLMMNQSHTNTAIRGTKGYVAPDWFRHMPITAKVDVYSYGVVLLEIICCRKSVCMESDLEDKAILTDWAYDCYQEGTLDALLEYDAEALDDRKRMEKFVKVAFWCIQEDPSLRPTMRKVTQMLDEVVEVLVPPY